MAVFTAPLIGSSGMAVPPLLPQISTAGCRSPIPMGVPPATMVAGISAPTTTSDDTVEMADNTSPPPAYALPADQGHHSSIFLSINHLYNFYYTYSFFSIIL